MSYHSALSAVNETSQVFTQMLRIIAIGLTRDWLRINCDDDVNYILDNNSKKHTKNCGMNQNIRFRAIQKLSLFSFVYPILQTDFSIDVSSFDQCSIV